MGPTSSSGPQVCRGQVCWWLQPRWVFSPRLPSGPGRTKGSPCIRSPVCTKGAISKSSKGRSRRAVFTLNPRRCYQSSWSPPQLGADVFRTDEDALQVAPGSLGLGIQMEMTESAVDSFCCQLVTSFRKWDRYLDIIRLPCSAWLSSSCLHPAPRLT